MSENMLLNNIWENEGRSINNLIKNGALTIRDLVNAGIKTNNPSIILNIAMWKKDLIVIFIWLKIRNCLIFYMQKIIFKSKIYF